MATETEALVVHEVNGPFKLETIKLDGLRPDEALVEIYATGVCHTDLSCASGVVPAQFPAVFGHEGTGIVVDAGSEVDNVAVGDQVLLSYSFCNSCYQCTSGHKPYCENLLGLNFGGVRQDGKSALSLGDGSQLYGHFFGQSSFSRKSIVHKASLVKVPKTGMSTSLLAPLGCGMQTGAGAILNTLDVQADSTVAIFGVGSVGLSAVMAAKIRRAKQIIAVDINPSRLELAKELGATVTINSAGTNVVEEIKKLCPPVGVQFALDCSGIPKVIEDMIDSLGIRGKACSVGAPTPGKRAAVDVFSHLVMGRQYVGCHQGESVAQEMALYLIDQHERGMYPLERLITEYDAKDFQKALEDTKKGITIKAVLKWK